MKRASWASRAINIIAACALCAGCSTVEPDKPPPGVLHLTQAQLATSSPGDIAAPAPNRLELPPQLDWVDTVLPHALPRSVLPATGAGKMESQTITAWYRIDLPAGRVTGEMGALYLPRWHTFGNVSIYANGELVYSSLAEGDVAGFNQPILIRIPAALLAQSQPFRLVVRMDFERQVGAALSTLWLGSVAGLRPMFDARYWLQNRVPQITSLIFLVLGLFALGLWFRRRHETTQLLFFVMSVLFYLRDLHYYEDVSWFSPGWISWLTVNTLGWLNICVYFFAYFLHRQRYRIFEGLLIGAVLAVSVATLPLDSLGTARFALLTYLTSIAISLGVTAVVSFAAWRARSLECGVLAAILWLNLGLGVHDWMLTSWLTSIESIYFLPIGVVALLALFLVTILRRFVTALTSSENAGELLRARLEQRERELGDSYARLREVEQAQLLSQERQRLMREMHDGLGSELMSSLMAVQRGQMQAPEIVEVLRACVDDLKLTIDSLEPVGDDLLILLATLRYRVEGRLEAAGVELHWQVADGVPALAWLNPALSLHILRMMQEIFTNVLKHAHARTITVSVTHDADCIEIAVSDDGVGFDAAKAGRGRHGLENLRQRAAILKATLSLQGAQGGTRVTLRLPIRLPADVNG